MNTTENMNIENHKTRKSSAKRIQKEQEVFIPVKEVRFNDKMQDDKIGRVVGEKRTNSYRQRLNKEKNNFSVWMERVKKSQEFGQKIHLINTEIVHNNHIKLLEEIEAKRLTY